MQKSQPWYHPDLGESMARGYKCQCVSICSGIMHSMENIGLVLEVGSESDQSIPESSGSNMLRACSFRTLIYQTFPK